MHLWLSGNVLYPDNTGTAVDCSAAAAALDMHLDNVGAFVEDNLIGLTVVLSAEYRYLVIGDDNLAVGIISLYAIKNPLVAVQYTSEAVEVLVHAINGIVHIVEILCSITRRTIFPISPWNWTAVVIWTGAETAWDDVVCKCDDTIVAYVELRLFDAEEIEREWNINA